MSIPLLPSSDFSFGQWFTTLFEKKIQTPTVTPCHTQSPLSKHTSNSSVGSHGTNQAHPAKYWVDWFLSSKGNDYFVKVDDSFIMDRFNLVKLDEYVPCYYSQALDMLTDKFDYREYDQNTRLEVERTARHLYGLIHARFILTNTGMSKMLMKYKQAVYGSCPRYFCNNQSLLPVGLSDQPFQNTMKLYCPHCEDVYNNIYSPQRASIDGAYFGTTFTHLFVQSHPLMLPAKSSERYVPRIFGFKIMASTHPLYAQQEEQHRAQQQPHQKEEDRSPLKHNPFTLSDPHTSA